MTTTVYKFADGRLLVKESRKVESNYRGSGVPVRIGQVRRVEEIIALDTDYSQYGLLTPLSEVRVSNNNIFVVMRRGDLGTALTSGFASGCFGNNPEADLTPGISGLPAIGAMSGIASGLGWLAELRSGGIAGGNFDFVISGVVTVYATVLGY